LLGALEFGCGCVRLHREDRFVFHFDASFTSPCKRDGTFVKDFQEFMEIDHGSKMGGHNHCGNTEFTNLKSSGIHFVRRDLRI
jgi:hypothetical protein